MSIQQGGIVPLSEQYLYWATKTNHCSFPQQDGTTIEAALARLANDGVCEDQLHPYNPLPTALPAQQPPSQAAQGNAANYQHTSHLIRRNSTTRASVEVVDLLNEGGEVAISVPVFADPQNQGLNNWNTGVGKAYGVVVNPPPTSVVIGGHAVCIVAFEPDSTVPGGGYFICRNSWGTGWGSGLPSPAMSKAPRPGYGQISASYIDRFLWEAACL